MGFISLSLHPPLFLRFDFPFSDLAGFLFIAGAPIGEPVVQHGPFVMCNQQQIMQCFSDFQSGRLCPKPASHVLYE